MEQVRAADNQTFFMATFKSLLFPISTIPSQREANLHFGDFDSFAVPVRTTWQLFPLTNQVGSVGFQD